MTETQHLLICLAEECAEVQHRIFKALRFGLNEIQPEQALTNAERIAYELANLVAVLELLGDVLPINYSFGDFIAAKKVKVEKYMAYARTCGTVLPQNTEE